MRKLIVIAAIVLASTTAQAGQSRGLTLASADEPAAGAAPAKPGEASEISETSRSAEPATPSDVAKPADAPKFVERPAAVDTTQAATPTAAAQPTEADVAKPCTSQCAKADRPRHRPREWTESRIIGELHRHGIYW